MIFTELVDINEVRAPFESFSAIEGLVKAILAIDGKVKWIILSLRPDPHGHANSRI